MGALLEVYIKSQNKKYCDMCGCIMDADHESDICECCLDDLYKSDPGEEEI